ncbi:hypothetical protein AN4546.2 [Aspergillus nidulans FGSC A4]|uniref:KH domain RNA-binding protein (AFU_orthologue AFUA_2G02780) n=1 Tax=Emericella nidulans (strain FGSC A4 / ATCC 38163 / CBS 112.46 / NRRL 194 / M139) TaxID=227321 RepID=Q5B4I4_EMENI|nr:hypothetical protein [Aspergillus nidulans FGSC A4]EAA60889.1 hypothetical protein AN4546.2 [Aspergillus nidulans FGSC A4]CBF77283.1 TPA: KH domain RNA-binding protein (AFU_orthologue; AFUA_2G02780) [Aspergillus nidulans FGSC A4]|eukprot:XP_662150.1 hypothetical protein AN4546.2 [Aspergillus nidulans FGSC A4]
MLTRLGRLETALLEKVRDQNRLYTEQGCRGIAVVGSSRPEHQTNHNHYHSGAFLHPLPLFTLSTFSSPPSSDSSSVSSPSLFLSIPSSSFSFLLSSTSLLFLPSNLPLPSISLQILAFLATSTFPRPPKPLWIRPDSRRFSRLRITFPHIDPLIVLLAPLSLLLRLLSHILPVSSSTTPLKLENMDTTDIHETPIADETMTDAVNVGDEGDLEVAPKTEEEYAQSMLTLRAIVSSKEAGVIIGKAGKNVADLRDETGVKAGVSKVVPGVHDRVLTVTGALSGTARAYALVAKGLLEGAPQMGMGGIVSNNGTHPIRLLISHNQMGTIIGRQGLKIKHIQDASGVRMVAQKEMLPQSTERIVEVQGTPEGIEKAIWEIGKCLIDDWQRGTGTILYNPAVRSSVGSGSIQHNGGNSDSYNSRPYNRTGNGADFSDQSGGYGRRSNPDTSNRGYPLVTEDGEEIQTQNISIPADMVGCIIGRGGTKITEIRRSSGARISIAKAPHDETGERMFTIMGSAQANEKALYLLYENLEAEKTRRSQLQE